MAEFFNDSEFWVKKIVFAFLLVLACVLTSCLFESSETGLESWMEEKGLPTSYLVQTVSIGDLKASSAEVFVDTLPRAANYRAVLGHASNMSHDMVFDFFFEADTNFLKKYRSDDSAGAFLLMALEKEFYTDKAFPEDSLNVEENVNLRLSWVLAHGGKKSFKDSLNNVVDSLWYESLEDWSEVSVYDTTLKISLGQLDSALRLDMPEALVKDLKETERFTRLQLKLEAPEASRLYRFYAVGSDSDPLLSMYAGAKYLTFSPSRMASIIHNEEDCRECLVLHGGVFDSLVVEIPPEAIMKALSDFYGDDFPVSSREEYDVRQNVILAELTMARDDSKGFSELGLPIQVVVGSFVDSAGTFVRKMENYRLNNEEILEIGHQNLVFHDGDSLKVQLTMGLRDFINRAQDNRSFKFMMRLGFPFLQEKDTTYTTYLTDEGDTVRLRLGYSDYARYDFSSVLESSMTLKLWLASKRAMKEEE